MKPDFICIEGNIGVGKTTLVKRLAQHFKSEILLEEFNENPWLPLFYENPKDAALALELSFLTDRCKQLLKVKPNTISDYCLNKCLLFAEINLTEKDFETYKKLFNRISSTIKKPDVVIILHTSTEVLLQNIKSRGRVYEQSIQADYLEKLNNNYQQFFSQEKEYFILNIFIKKINEQVYENIFQEVISYLAASPTKKITNITL